MPKTKAKKRAPGKKKYPTVRSSSDGGVIDVEPSVLEAAAEARTQEAAAAAAEAEAAIAGGRSSNSPAGARRRDDAATLKQQHLSVRAPLAKDTASFFRQTSMKITKAKSKAPPLASDASAMSLLWFQGLLFHVCRRGCWALTFADGRCRSSVRALVCYAPAA